MSIKLKLQKNQMDCKCIKGNYNFILSPLDTNTLLYQDMSDWMEHDYYIKPEKYVASIKPPHTNKYIDVELSTTGHSVLYSKDLGFGDACLPDGVYCFRVESCGNIFTRYKGVTAGLECKLSCALSRGVDPFQISKLSYQLKTVHYNLEQDMPIEANKILKVVKREVDLIECDCNCCQN